MNKWQIICPVAAIITVLTLVAVFGLPRHSRLKSQAYILAQTRMIGQELADTTNSPHLSRVAPVFRNRLSEFLTSPSGVAEVLLGDERAPFGDGMACSRLVLTNSAGARLGIRLGQEPGSQRFYLRCFR